MTSELRTSENGLKLIMAYEGFRPVSKQLPDGRWVIGYGHTKAARANLRVSQEEAAAILREYDLPPVEKALLELLLVPVNQNEFDALASFAFNIGIDQFEESDVLAHLNSGERLEAAASMESWRRARVGTRDMIVEPLVRRRADEKALFLKTIGAVPIAASSRFRPVMDQPSRPIEATVRPRSGRVIDEIERSGQNETATEIAARNVRERLTRILGEEENIRSADDQPAEEAVAHEASVEEIRAAISALVAEDEDDAPDTRPETGDLELEEITLSGDKQRTRARDGEAFDIEDGSLHARAQNGSLYIDDLGTVEVDPETMRRAQLNDAPREGPIETFIFGLIAFFGAGIFAYGGAEQFGWFGVEPMTRDGLIAYMPPFMMLAGGLLALVMSYYSIRALVSHNA